MLVKYSSRTLTYLPEIREVTNSTDGVSPPVFIKWMSQKLSKMKSDTQDNSTVKNRKP